MSAWNILHRMLLVMTISLLSEPIAATVCPDQSALQAGATLYANYCVGCHSLQYLSKDCVGVTFDALTKPGMPAAQAKQLFGLVPPDLSLVARARGTKWLRAFLLGFYPDSTRLFGSNNHVFPQVAMPDVLAPLQKNMSAARFDKTITDLIYFLDYVAEPVQQERKTFGWYILLFLGFWLIFAYLLKKSYWRSVKK
ncbi:MAG: cytochrome c1 [Legionellaceae bacterium]|nr:cytochrome c1 [Legionellaceae bacterium]